MNMGRDDLLCRLCAHGIIAANDKVWTRTLPGLNTSETRYEEDL